MTWEKPILLVLYDGTEEGPHSVLWEPLSDMLKANEGASRVIKLLDDTEPPPDTIVESAKRTAQGYLALGEGMFQGHSVTAVHVYRLDPIAIMTREGELMLGEWEEAPSLEAEDNDG